MKRSLGKEFTVPLNQVERWWIRIPATILLIPINLLIIIVVGSISGIIESMIIYYKDFFVPSILGTEIKQKDKSI